MTETFNGGVVIETILPVSVPSGGSTGQVLTKKSSVSYDIGWVTPTGGGGGGSGTVTNFSFTNGNGFTGVVTNSTTTPTLSLTLQDATTSQSGKLTSADWNTFNSKQAQLVSATNIKTINGNSLLGAGDLTISGGGGSGTVTTTSVVTANGFAGTVANPTTTPAITITTPVTGILKGNGTAISAAVSGTDLKTIGGISIIGSGDIPVGGTGTVTSASIVTANGLSGSVANATTTPALTLSTTVNGLVKGNGTSFSAAVAGTDYLLPTGSGASLTGITVSQVSGAAALASPTFTGVPVAPTAAVDTSTTQLATTAYVVNQGYLKSATATSTYATIASQGTAAAGVLTTSTTDTTVGRVTKVGDYGIGTAPISSDNWNTVVASGKYRNTLTSATGVPEATAGLLMTNTYIDANTATQMGWNTSSGAVYTRNKIGGSWGSWTAASSGGVTTVSVVTANGFNGSVATATTTPAITVGTSVTGILKGNGTAISAAVSGTDLKTINGTSIIGSGDIVISGGSGTVTTASVVSANGFAGSVANPSTTPAITISTSVTGLLKGNGTAISAATSGTDYLAPANVTSSSVDVTAGKLLKVGDYGLGTAPVSNDNWNTIAVSGRYINTLTSATGIPVALAGLILNHTFIDSNTATQVAWDVLNNVMYTRRKQSGTFSGWSAGISAASGITRSVVVSSGSFTAGSATLTDYVYLLAGAHPPTLPTAVGNTNRYTFKNNHSAAVTISTTSSQTIDGTTTISIAPQASVDLISTGSNWSII